MYFQSWNDFAAMNAKMYMGSRSCSFVIPLGLKAPKTITFCNKPNPKMNMSHIIRSILFATLFKPYVRVYTTQHLAQLVLQGCSKIAKQFPPIINIPQ